MGKNALPGELSVTITSRKQKCREAFDQHSAEAAFTFDIELRPSPRHPQELDGGVATGRAATRTRESQ
jgi:hypothetical protein